MSHYPAIRISVLVILFAFVMLQLVSIHAKCASPLHEDSKSNTFIQVGLVVETKTGDIVKCVNISANGRPTGYTVLQQSGIDLIATENGEGVCAMNGTGCNYPDESCFCQCQSLSANYLQPHQFSSRLIPGGNGDCFYWAYYHLGNEEWKYANTGPADYLIKGGMVEGWKWSGLDDKPPKVYLFKEICDPRG